MTDRLDELQRLHDAVGKTSGAAGMDARRLADYAYARFNLTNAAEKHLPALLRVARAAAEADAAVEEAPSDRYCINGKFMRAIRAALAELRGEKISHG